METCFSSNVAGGAPVGRRWVVGGSPTLESYIETRF